MTKKWNETHYKKYLTNNEHIRLREYFHQQSDVWKFIYDVMSLSGLRISDVITLKVENLHGRCFTKIMQKTKKAIIWYMPADFHAWLTKYYIPKYEDYFQDGYLCFANNNYSRKLGHTHMSAASVRWKLIQAKHELGFVDDYYTAPDGRRFHRITPHTMRHFLAQNAWEISDHNIKVVQKLLGHVKADTTLKYYVGGFFTEDEHLAFADKIGEVVGACVYK